MDGCSNGTVRDCTTIDELDRKLWHEIMLELRSHCWIAIENDDEATMKDLTEAMGYLVLASGVLSKIVHQQRLTFNKQV